MIANQGSLLTSSNLFGKTQYKSRKDTWVVRCSGITCWIGRGDIVNHLLGIQETNSRLVYHTHTHVISRVCLGSEPDLLMFTPKLKSLHFPKQRKHKHKTKTLR